LLSDPVAERAAVAGACQSRDHYLNVCDVVRTDSFTDPANAALWKCVEHVYEDERPPERIDVATLMSVANQKGLKFLFEKREDTAQVRRVLDMDVTAVSVEKMAAKVRKLHILRQAVEKVRGVEKSLLGMTGAERPDAILAAMEMPLLDFTANLRGLDAGVRRLGEEAARYVEHRLANPCQQLGIPTGFPHYDEFIGGGLRPNSVNVVAARNKVGKSFFGANVAVNIAYRGIPVLLLDTEMSEEEQLDRVLARIASIPSRLIERGVPGHTQSQKQALLEAAAKLKDMPLDYLVIRGLEFEEVIAHARRWVYRNVGFVDGKAKPCAIVYDYLKLMDDKAVTSRMGEHQLLGFMMGTLKNFVGRYHVASLVGAQTNRDGIEGEGENVVAGSDRIGWFCTSLALLKWKTDAERAEVAHVGGQHYTHKLFGKLTRHGERMDDGDYINVATEYKFGRMKEGPRAFELSNQMLKGGGGAPPKPGEAAGGGHEITFG
jgi:replicative DNA helicase